MGIKMTTTMGDLNKYMQEDLKKLHNTVISVLSYLGEECMRFVRDRSGELSWYDQTGNLRSSIGYVIAVDGKVQQATGFTQVNGANEGVDKGREYALNLASLNKKGYVLIIVAGMNYASYVEDMDNKDVLASSELYARKRAGDLFNSLKTNILE